MSSWYTGTGITGEATAGTAFPGSGVSQAVAGDLYLNSSAGADKGNVYACVLGGTASAALWTYVFCLAGSDALDGSTPNVQVGTVETLQAGEEATVERRASSPDSAPVFDFGIPKGPSGAGGMQAATYDPTGVGEDIFAYALPKSGGSLTGALTAAGGALAAKGVRSVSGGESAPPAAGNAAGDLYLYFRTL